MPAWVQALLGYSLTTTFSFKNKSPSTLEFSHSLQKFFLNTLKTYMTQLSAYTGHACINAVCFFLFVQIFSSYTNFVPIQGPHPSKDTVGVAFIGHVLLKIHAVNPGIG